MLMQIVCKVLLILSGFYHCMLVICVVPGPLMDNSVQEEGSLVYGKGGWVGGTSVDARRRRWAEAAYYYIRNFNCNDAFYTTSKECRQLVATAKSSIAIHMTDPAPEGRFRVTLPDEPLTRPSETHDAVVVLDPYPTANFGHLVIVFYIDLDASRSICQREGGIYLEYGECMQLALRKRCKNALERRGKRRNFARRCEINFLPVVHLESQDATSYYMEKTDNRLSCRSDISGFASCPELRPVNETSDLICNPIRDNTQRCSTTHETIHTSCRVFEICDQALILSGGWNRQTTGIRHKHNVEMMYKTLRQNGFKRRNIKIFFANGAHGIQVAGEHPHQAHPAAMKLAFRYHLQKLCASPHCVDSLVLYMNNPAKNDGTSLLWDVNQDGLADESERYAVEELFHDLSYCAARRVHVIVDQSYSGQIAEKFRNSKKHKNVVVFAATKDSEYAYADEYTSHWVQANHTRMCSWEIHEQSQNTFKRSTPVVEEGSPGQVRTTIFGSPCDVVPPFTKKELSQNYLGCQNLPTAMWLQVMLDSPGSTFPDSDSFVASRSRRHGR